MKKKTVNILRFLLIFQLVLCSMGWSQQKKSMVEKELKTSTGIWHYTMGRKCSRVEFNS